MKLISKRILWLGAVGMACLPSNSPVQAEESPAQLQSPAQRDPTVPSPSLKPRGVSQEGGAASTPVKLPDWRVKALVVQNRDRGSVILAVGDRSIALQLQRQGQSPLCKFTLAGVEYDITDFDTVGVQVRGPWGSLWIR